MKVPMKWLKEYTEINLPAAEYADKMVMAGNGVEGIDNTGDLFDSRRPKYNLKYYAYKTVSVPLGTLLVMQESPRGAFMSTSYTNGESILVNMRYAENGYLLAYKNGVYGYVDMNYVNL